mgnify:FL=1
MTNISYSSRLCVFRGRQCVRSGYQRARHFGTVPLRDFIELQNRSNIIRRHDFFSQRGKTQSYGGSRVRESLLDYDPILTQCIARWLWLNYKITDYPYYDLNIFNVFTDLPQSIYFMRKIMQYFQKVLPSESFTRINYYLIPLYRCNKTDKEHMLRDIPGNVHLIEETTLFPLNKPIDLSYRNNNEIFINDPVRILMFNDIFSKLTHDLVRYEPESHEWQQCYVGETSATLTDTTAPPPPIPKQFSNDLDYWCEHTLRYLYGSPEGDMHLPKFRNHNNELYIPTQFVQLLEQLKVNAPDYRLFAIDTPFRSSETLVSRLQRLLQGRKRPASADAETVGLDFPAQHSSNVRFKPDFLQLQTIMNHVNESDTHGIFQPCETETLGEFCDKWVDVKVKQRTDSTNALPQEFLDRLQFQLAASHRSPLTILHT